MQNLYADEVKTKLWARWNNYVNWGAQKDFIQYALVKTCQLPVVQGENKGSFIPFHEHFHECWKQFCLNPVRGMSLRKVTLLGSNLASVTDLKRIETPHSLCCDFGSYKTFTTRCSGGRFQV